MDACAVIPWMDLKRQYCAHKKEYLEIIEKVCEETAFSGGDYAERFEKDFAGYCGVKAAAAVNSGTSALFLAAKALGIGADDEVIIPANTFIATAWGASHNGAVPVFADIDPDTFELCPQSIEKKITDKTRAIIGVHLYGQPFDVYAVKQIAKQYNLFLIEDCAQAHGALYRGKRVGGLGDAGCFSFYPGKNLGAFGEGGAVTSDSEEVVQEVNILKNHGMRERYYHDKAGYNMRMEGIQAAVLSCKLRYIEQWNQRRYETAQKYRKGIKNRKIKKQLQPDWCRPVFHLFVIEVDDRRKFAEHLEKNGVLYGIHYPVPCHLQAAYKNLGYHKGDLPNAEYHAEHCISLPMFPELTDDEISRVIDVCNAY